MHLAELGFSGVDPEATGRPSYHPSVLLKLYIYGYPIGSSRAAGSSVRPGRNVEVMWLTGRLVPDHKTIADFRKDNGRAIRRVCARFVVLCRTIGLFTEASVAIDGSKFKAVNNCDKNFTRAKMERRMAQIEESVARYLSAPAKTVPIGRSMDVDISLRAPRGSHADTRLRGNPRGCDGGICEELAAGVTDARRG
jgi:transposase